MSWPGRIAMMLARRAPDGPDGCVPARASERTLLAVAAGSVENRQQALHPSVVVHAGHLRTRSAGSAKAYCVTCRLGGRFHETRGSLHDPLAAGGHREFCVSIATCPWASFANSWNGMCVPIWPLPSTASGS